MSYFDLLKSGWAQLTAARKIAGRGDTYDRISRQYRQPGSQRRNYRVFVPHGCKNSKPAPLVMVLHGCRQTHHDIQLISEFDQLAARNKFIVVYPFVTRYSDLRTRNCWGWWRPEHIKSGAGEVQDLWHVVEEVADEFSVDRSRVHIAGLSSGGGMAVAAMTVHVGRFASGAVVAGVSYGERVSAVALPYANVRSYRPVDRTVAMMAKARDDSQTPAPLCIVHSHDDETVAIEAGKNLRDSWLQYFGYHHKPVKSVNHKRTKGVPWTHTKYGRRFGKSVVETVFLEGPDHGWYGGAPGRFSYPAGPRVSQLIWKFFKQHRARALD